MLLRLLAPAQREELQRRDSFTVQVPGRGRFAILPRRSLNVLDLESGRISDEGARILAACPDVRHLERLRLAWNQLTPVGIGLLQRAGARLEADGQHTADQIEEHQHVWEGDCE